MIFLVYLIYLIFECYRHDDESFLKDLECFKYFSLKKFKISIFLEFHYLRFI